jgi:hypothetical protein
MKSLPVGENTPTLALAIATMPASLLAVEIAI